MTNAWQKRKLTLTWATLECLFFGGMIGGWLRFLLPVLVENSYFAELCPLDVSANVTSLEEALQLGEIQISGEVKMKESVVKRNKDRQYYQSGYDEQYDYNQYYYEYASPYTNVTCARQRYELGQVYTVALVAASIMSVFGGILYDSCGTLKTRIATTLMLTAATLLMAFTGPDHSWFLYPMAALMATAGFMLVLTCLQIGNLFDSCRHTAIALLIGASDSGRAIMFFMRRSSEGGLGIQLSFMFISVHIIPLLIGTIAMFPHRWIKWPLPEDMITARATPQITLNGIRKASIRGRNRINRSKKKDPPILALLRTRVFISQMIWFAVMTLRLFHYEYHLQNQLGPVDSTEVTNYLEIFDYTQMWGIVITPCMGYMLDMNTSDLTGHSRKQQVMYNSCIGHSITTAIMALLSVLALIPGFLTIYPIFIIHAICRPLVYTLTVSTLATVFPMAYFGRLVGFCHAGLAMVILILELPLRVLSHHLFSGQSFWTNLILFFVTLAVSFHPYMVKHHNQPIADNATATSGDGDTRDHIELGAVEYSRNSTAMSLVPQRNSPRTSISITSDPATAQIDL